MGLRIATNIASQSVQKNLTEISGEAEGWLSKLSSGKRITKSSDDAAGLAIAASLKAQTQGLRQATRNANDGIGFVQVGEGGLNEIGNIIVRLRQLALQSASDTIGDKERILLTQEHEQLIQEVDRIAAATTFNGASLLNGENSEELIFQIGTFAGKENQLRFDPSIYDARASSLGIDSAEIESQEDAVDSIATLDEALGIVNAQRANFGAIQSRLQATVRNLGTQTLNQDAARSVIEDVDVAFATSRLASNNVIKSAGIASLAQANSIPASALRLL